MSTAKGTTLRAAQPEQSASGPVLHRSRSVRNRPPPWPWRTRTDGRAGNRHRRFSQVYAGQLISWLTVLGAPESGAWIVRENVTSSCNGEFVVFGCVISKIRSLNSCLVTEFKFYSKLRENLKYNDNFSINDLSSRSCALFQNNTQDLDKFLLKS